MAKAPPIRFGSFCSGIEAASKAFLPLGWECGYVAEIEPFACAYLAQRYGATRPVYMPKPEEAEDEAEAKRRRAAIKAIDRIQFGDRLLNLGDLSQVSARELPAVDLTAAGFPCQDFSIAGLRSSLNGARGNLSITGTRLLLEAAELGLVRAALLEQVPDVLNTADNAWGNILGALVGADAALEGLEHGGKWPRAGMVAGPRSRIAWRILDAQHFRLAQRRERVWAVVDFGDGPDPAAVLFERKGVPGDFAPSGGENEDVAPTLAGGARKRGGFSTDDIPAVRDGPQRRAAFGGNNTSGPIDVATVRTASHTASHTASGRQDFETETFVVDGHGSMARSAVAPPLRAAGADAGHGSEAMVAHSLRGEGFDASEDGTGRGTPVVPVYAIQERACGENPDSGPDGVGIRTDVSYTLEAREKAQAVAYSIMPQNSGKDYKAREVDVAQPVMAAGPAGGNQGGDYIVQPIAFNARQDPISGPVVGPVDTDGGTHAIAFSLRGRAGGAMPEVEAEDVVPSLRAADGGSTRPFVAVSQATEYNSHHADAEKARPVEALRALRKAVGSTAAEEWGLGVLASLWPQEVLRSDMHGSGVRRAPEQEHGVVNGALPFAQDGGQGALREVREAGRQRRAPQGWEPSEQHALELGAYLSGLSQSGASPESIVHDLRRAGYRPRLLQQALHSLQEARRSAGIEDSATTNVLGVRSASPREGLVRQAPSAASPGQARNDAADLQRGGSGGVEHPTFVVRRISVVEAEILQGFPPNDTLIDWPSANRKGEDLAETIAYLMGHGLSEADARQLAQTPDGPRYKAIGNSWPVTVPAWIGRRISAVWKRSAAERAA